jgi:hypothetical protein
MYQPLENDFICARFEFKEDRALEFDLDEGQVIKQFEFPNTVDGIEELTSYCEEFQTALVDVTALVNGKVIRLSEFPKA